ncbi:MAG: hypothetical protein QOE29_2285 [Gaiellaceae bacterium]|jgi:hypothetical protein|nr:hypothetical protein [Gaiellaceae bacterium]
MHGPLGFLLADAASEGRHVVIGMLLVGLFIIAVIALGELTHWAGSRRKARKAGRKAY